MHTTSPASLRAPTLILPPQAARVTAAAMALRPKRKEEVMRGVSLKV